MATAARNSASAIASSSAEASARCDQIPSMRKSTPLLGIDSSRDENRPLLDGRAVAVQARVDLQMHGERRCIGVQGGEGGLELGDGRDPDIDATCSRGREVSARTVEPCEQSRFDAGIAQGESGRYLEHAESRRPASSAGCASASMPCP